MSMYYSDLYVNTVAKGLLETGETLTARSSAKVQPWWSFKLPMLGASYLILATDRRVVFIKHRKGWITGYRMEEINFIPWTNIDEIKIKGFLAKKKLLVRAERKTLNMKVQGGFFEIKDNIKSLGAIADSWKQRKALPA